VLGNRNTELLRKKIISNTESRTADKVSKPGAKKENNQVG